MEHSLEMLLAPVSDSDPCGPDLRWDPVFTSLLSDFEAATAGAEGVVVGAEAVDAGSASLDSLLLRVDRLLAASKDLRVLAIRTEVAWRHRGLEGFRDALEETLELLARWPDPPPPSD